MERRHFIPTLAAAFVPQGRYRVVLIGNSTSGGFGHDWDVAWNDIPNGEVVALADPDEKGRAKAAARSRAKRTYSDYRQMLDKEKADIICVCPRTMTERVPMVLAAAQAKAHVLMEKPFATTLAEARQMEQAILKAGVKLQIGHPARIFGVTQAAREMLKSGKLGMLQEIRSRGKEDRRAGGEDLMVLGTHCFDLMRYFAGDPLWCMASMLDDATDLQPQMLREATEPIGKVGADNVAAMFLFPNGVHAYFGSKLNDRKDGRRFGVTLYGSKSLVFLPLSNVPSGEPFLLESSAWVPEKNETWQRIPYPKGTEVTQRPDTNKLMALDLLEAIEKHREPICNATDARWTIEMVQAVYQSQFKGMRLKFPLS